MPARPRLDFLKPAWGQGGQVAGADSLTLGARGTLPGDLADASLYFRNGWFILPLLTVQHVFMLADRIASDEIKSINVI